MSDFFATPKIIALQGLGPRDLSGKNTRVNHYFLLQVIFSMSQLGIKLMSPALKVDFFFFFFSHHWATMDSKFQILLTSIHTYPVQSFSVYPEITCFKMTVLVKRQKQTNKQTKNRFTSSSSGMYLWNSGTKICIFTSSHMQLMLLMFGSN